MAGIYIHVPFCRKKCPYCNFFSLATAKFRNEFHAAILKEIALTKGYLVDEPIETVYFGGGTPSLLPVGQLEEIFCRILEMYPSPAPPHSSPQEGRGVSNFEDRNSKIENPEITLEMNPKDVTPAYLEALSASPVNRLSVGIQSFFDEDLVYLGRNHSAEQAKRILDAGYWMLDTGYWILDNQSGQKPKANRQFSVDLIYGIPTLTKERWKENLQRVIDAGIPHISAYALTVEPKTPLAWAIKKGICSPVSDDLSSEHFNMLMDIMESNGYIQYEISNFCLPGHESRHNSNYWKGVPYLGIGPSAHSYNGFSRRWNPSSLTTYLQGIVWGNLIREEEILTPVQQYHEYIFTSLRTVWGCDQRIIQRRFGVSFSCHFAQQVTAYLSSGYLTQSGDIYFLTRKGKFIADRILMDLFMAE